MGLTFALGTATGFLVVVVTVVLIPVNVCLRVPGVAVGTMGGNEVKVEDIFGLGPGVVAIAVPILADSLLLAADTLSNQK